MGSEMCIRDRHEVWRNMFEMAKTEPDPVVRVAIQLIAISVKAIMVQWKMGVLLEDIE